MKLLYSVIQLLGVLQLVLTQTPEASASPAVSLNKFQLLQYYAEEINALSQETCIKFYNLSKQTLEDPLIQQPNSSLMQNFRINMTRFQEMYPAYMRYGLNKQLLLVFSDMTIDYYYQEPSGDKDVLYILQLIRKLGYDEIFDQFERKFVKFILTSFLPKFEEFKKQIPSNETQQWHRLFEWAEEIKACADYACFYNYFKSFDNIILTPREQIYAYARQQLTDISLFYGISIINIIKGVLKNKQLLQLNPAVRELLKQNSNHYIKLYESSNEINQLYGLLPLFYQNILLQFYSNSNLPTEQQQLLVNVFDEQGYAQFQRNYYQKFNDFAERGLYKYFDYFGAALKQEELLKEKPLLDWIQSFKRLTSYEDRIKALKGLFDIEQM